MPYDNNRYSWVFPMMIKPFPTKFILVVCSIITVLILFVWVNQLDKEEYLLVWETDNSTEVCNSWIIPLSNPAWIETSFSELPVACHFSTIQTNSLNVVVSHLPFNPYFKRSETYVQFFVPNKKKTFDLYKSITLNGIDLTSNFQSDSSGNTLVFSGIHNDKEKIFLMDTTMWHYTPIISATDGYVTEPSISPDGKYISYLYVQGQNSNQRECQNACFERFYHIWDIKNNIGINTMNFVQNAIEGSSVLHCDFTWLLETTIAFETGCGSGYENTVFVLDFHEGHIIYSATASTGSSINYLSQWGNGIVLSGQTENHTGYTVYSLETNTVSQLPLPLKNKFNEDTIGFEAWSQTLSYVIGRTITQFDSSNNSRVSNLVIADLNAAPLTVSYIEVFDEFIDVPKWSVTEHWIAFGSYNLESLNSSYRINIIDTGGQYVFNSNAQQLSDPQYLWIYGN